MRVRNLESDKSGEAVSRLYDQCRSLLDGLDENGLHQAAAHVSMALDVMRRSFPDLARDE